MGESLAVGQVVSEDRHGATADREAECVVHLASAVWCDTWCCSSRFVTVSVLAAPRRARHMGATGLQADTLGSICLLHFDTCERHLWPPF